MAASNQIFLVNWPFPTLQSIPISIVPIKRKSKCGLERGTDARGRQANNARGRHQAQAGRHADGAGLYLQVGPSGNKSWLFRYTRFGQHHYVGLGALHTVGEC